MSVITFTKSLFFYILFYLILECWVPQEPKIHEKRKPTLWKESPYCGKRTPNMWEGHAKTPVTRVGYARIDSCIYTSWEAKLLSNWATPYSHLHSIKSFWSVPNANKVINQLSNPLFTFTLKQILLECSKCKIMMMMMMIGVATITWELCNRYS